MAGVPVFEVPPDKYSAYGIMNLLLDPKINENKIATKRPLESSFSASYVVDVSTLTHPDDIKKDMYDKWIHSGSHADVFRCTYIQNYLALLVRPSQTQKCIQINSKPFLQVVRVV